MESNISYYLGCDVSLRGSGFAIVGVRNGKPFFVKSTTIKTTSKMTDGESLYKLSVDLQKFVKGYTFKEIIREKGFSRFNLSTQQVFKATGVVELILHEQDAILVTPTQVKKVVGDHGAAEKREVLNGVCRVLDIPIETFVIPPTGRRKKAIYLEDESDACGVVLTYLIQQQII